KGSDAAGDAVQRAPRRQRDLGCQSRVVTVMGALETRRVNGLIEGPGLFHREVAEHTAAVADRSGNQCIVARRRAQRYLEFALTIDQVELVAIIALDRAVPVD